MADGSLSLQHVNEASQTIISSQVFKDYMAEERAAKNNVSDLTGIEAKSKDATSPQNPSVEEVENIKITTGQDAVNVITKNQRNGGDIEVNKNGDVELKSVHGPDSATTYTIPAKLFSDTIRDVGKGALKDQESGLRLNTHEEKLSGAIAKTRAIAAVQGIDKLPVKNQDHAKQLPTPSVGTGAAKASDSPVL